MVPVFNFLSPISLPILVRYFCSIFNSYLPGGSRGKYPPLSPTLRWLIILVYTTQTEKLPDQNMSLFLTINKHVGNFISVCSEVNSTLRITSELTTQKAWKTLFTRVVVRVVTHNPPRVVTPISPCGISVINKKAHGRKCRPCLSISSLFPTRHALEILLWSSIGERVTLCIDYYTY